MGKAKRASIFIMLVSITGTGTGFFYVKRKNPWRITEKLEFRKYDPRVNNHVMFTNLCSPQCRPRITCKSCGSRSIYTFNLDQDGVAMFACSSLQLQYFVPLLVSYSSELKACWNCKQVLLIDTGLQFVFHLLFHMNRTENFFLPMWIEQKMVTTLNWKLNCWPDISEESQSVNHANWAAAPVTYHCPGYAVDLVALATELHHGLIPWQTHGCKSGWAGLGVHARGVGLIWINGLNFWVRMC
jgi:large subunit ribosomal protein L33